MKQNIFLLLALLTFTFSNCSKTSVVENNTGGTGPSSNPLCTKIATVKVTATPSVITIGESTTITATAITGAQYLWNTPYSNGGTGTNINITNAGLKDRGWYYVTAYSQDCTNTKTDSIYLNVKLLQGTPTCTIASNTVNNTILTNETYTNTTRGTNPLTLEASTLQGSVKVIFHPKWNTTEPEDGIYKTINIPTFDGLNPDFNKVFFTMTKNSIYWASWADQDVYVSHVNGKLQVRFCTLSLSGSNGGNSYINKASANLIQN